MGEIEAIARVWFAVAVRITLGLAAGSLIVAGMLRRFPKVPPEARHGLWALVLLQGLLWFQIPVWVPARARPDAKPAAQANSSPAIVVTRPAAQRFDTLPPVVSSSGAAGLEPTGVESASRPGASSPGIWPKSAIPWKLALSGVWLTGVAALWLLLAFRFWRLRRWVMAGATPAPRSLQETARKLAERHGDCRTFRLLWSEHCRAPMLIGLIRPTIILPRWLAALPKEESEPLVAHEVAHLCRRDRLFAVLSLVSCLLNYFNPFAWWAERRMSVTREESVDRWVTQTAGYSRQDYSRALVTVAEAMSHRSLGRLGAARRPSELRRRIEAMQKPEGGRTRGGPRPARILGAFLVAAVLISLVSVRQSRPTLADDRTAEADGRVDPAAERARVRRRSPTPRATAWGRQSHGLRCRARVPLEVEQGMPMVVKVELRSIARRLDPEVKKLNTFLPAAFLELSLVDQGTQKRFTVRPYDPTQGMPAFDSGEDTAPLDGTPLKLCQVGFPLAKLYEQLQPGSYACRVEYSFPSKPTSFWAGSETEWKKAGFWQGTVFSGPFHVKVIPETPKTRTLLLPRRLRVEKELVRLRLDDEKKTPVPVIRFRSEDAEPVTVPVRNGHFVMAQYGRDGEFTTLTAPPKPDDVNSIDTWYDYKGGDERASYTIEVFETRDRPMHGWLPSPSSGGYKVLWRRTFAVSVLEKGLRELPESVLEPGADRPADAERRPSPPAEPVAATAARLTQLHLAKKWPEVQALLDELFAGDRTFAAEVISIVLRNPKIETRTHLISDAERAGLKEIVPTLVSLLDDSDKGVRAWSVGALGDLGDRQAIGPLQRLLEQEQDPYARHGIRLSLAKLGRPYLGYFISGLSDRDIRRRDLCIGALGILKDKRAVPQLLKILEESTDTWGPFRAANAITRITGIESTVVIKTVKRADGSVNTEGRRRPVDEFRKDCLAWLARHRDEVSMPVEKPCEPWKYTPEPFLPGLNVAFTMDARQVADVYRKAGLECRHHPERRWEKGGGEFREPEQIGAAQSCLDSLNEGLLGIRYVFENNRLEQIYIELVDRGGDLPVEPLVAPLKLCKRDHSSWLGLDGSIVVHFESGDAEKETWVIRLRRWREGAN